MQLGELGPGFPLYLHTKLFTAVISFCMLLILGLPMTYIHLKKENGGEWVSDGETVFLTRFSLGNHGKGSEKYASNQEMYIILILNSCFLIVFVFLSYLLRSQQDSIIQGVDDKLITPSDFTIMVYNIPKDKTSDEFKRWLDDHHWSSDIISVSYCYDIRQMVSL